MTGRTGAATAADELTASATPSAASPDELVDEVPTDGRAARAARTRQAIVDGLLSLLEEGDLQPTANRIAERAGISLRLIYHHFGDLESLFRATAVRQAERMAAEATPIDAHLPLEARIAAFTQQRARMLEWITPVRRAALLHEPFSEELRRAREAFMRAGDAQVSALFADALDPRDAPDRDEVLAGLLMVTSWSAWDALRSSGHSVEAASGAMRRAISALLAS